MAEAAAAAAAAATSATRNTKSRRKVRQEPGARLARPRRSRLPEGGGGVARRSAARLHRSTQASHCSSRKMCVRPRRFSGALRRGLGHSGSMQGPRAPHASSPPPSHPTSARSARQSRLMPGSPRAATGAQASAQSARPACTRAWGSPAPSHARPPSTRLPTNTPPLFAESCPSARARSRC
eukprot:11563-Chlamydomonas_euryale.AAC.3